MKACFSHRRGVVGLRRLLRHPVAHGVDGVHPARVRPQRGQSGVHGHAGRRVVAEDLRAEVRGAQALVLQSASEKKNVKLET